VGGHWRAREQEDRMATAGLVVSLLPCLGYIYKYIYVCMYVYVYASLSEMNNITL